MGIHVLGHLPRSQEPRPLSPPDQADLDCQLAIWLKQRVIVPAVKGAWPLNLVPVRKKGVAACVRRWTLDARGINSISEPRPEYIGSVGPHQTRPHPQSFVCNTKILKFSMCCSGYGFKNSPAALEKLGTALMRPIPANKGNKYMDDFLLKDCDPGELLRTLCIFLDQKRAATVKI